MGDQDLVNRMQILQNENMRLREQLSMSGSVNFEEKYKKALRQIQGIIIANRQLKEELLKLKNSRNAQIQMYVKVHREQLAKAYDNILAENRQLAVGKENLQLQVQQLKFSLGSLEETVSRLKEQKMELAQVREANEKVQKYIYSPQRTVDQGVMDRTKTQTKEQLHIYKQKQAELRRTLQNYEEHHTTLNRVNRRLEENINDLEKKLFTVQSEFRNQLNEKDIELREVKSVMRQEYQNQISQLKRQIHQLRSYNNELSIKIQADDLQKQTKFSGQNQYELQFVQTLKELKVQMEPMSLQIAELQDKNQYEKEQSIRQKTSLQMKITEMQSMVQRYKENQKFLQQRLVKETERVRQLEEVEKSLSKLEEENRILGGRVIVLESKEVTLRNRSGDDLEERVMQFQSRIEMLLNDKQTIPNMKNISLQQLVALKAYIIELDTKLKQLVNENQYSMKKYKSYKEKCQHLMKELKQNDKTVNAMKGKIVGYDKLVVKLQGQLQRAIAINDNEVKALNAKASEASNTSLQIYKRRYESIAEKLSLQEKYSEQELQTVKLHYQTKLVELNIKLEQLGSLRETISLYKSKNEELSLKLSQKQNQLLDEKMVKQVINEPPPSTQANLLATKEMITKLNDTLSLKQTQIFNLENQLKSIDMDWKKKYNTLQQEITVLSHQIDQKEEEKQNQIETIQRENEEQRNKIIDCQNKIYLLTNDQQQKESVSKKIQEVEKQMNEAEGELKEVEAKLENEQNKNSKLNKINEEYMKTIKELESQLTKTRHEVNKIQNEAKIQIEEKNSDMKKLRMKVQELETNIELSNSMNQGTSEAFKIGKLKIQMEILESQRKNLEQEKNKHQSKISQLEAELSLTKSKQEELEFMLEKTKQATANSNNQNLLEYQNEVQKLQQKNTSLTEKIKEYTQQLSEQKTFYENLRQDFSNEKKRLLYELESKEEEYSKMYRECNRLKHEIANRTDWENNIVYENEQKANRYMSQINRLKDEIMRLEDKYAFEQRQYIKHRQELSLRVTQLTDNINDRDEKVMRIQSELTFLKNKLPEFEDLLNSKQSFIGSLNAEMMQLKDRQLELENYVGKLSSQLNYMRSRDEEMQISFEERGNYLNRLSQDLNDLRNRQSELEAELGQKNLLNSKLASEISFMKNEKEHLEDTIRRKQTDFVKANSDMTNQKNYQLQLQSQLSNCEKNLAKLTSEVVYYKNQMQALDYDLSSKNQQILKFKSRVSQLEENYNQASDKLYENQIITGKLTADIKYKTDYTEKLEEDIEVSHQRVTELQSEIMRYRNQYSDMDTNLLEKDTKLSRLNYEIATLQRKCEQYQEELNVKQTNLVSTVRELSIFKSNLQVIEEELTSKSSTIERYRQDLKIQSTKVEELNEEVFEKNKDINKLNQEIFRIKLEAGQKNNEEIFRLQSEVYQLKNNYNKIQGQIQVKTFENENLKAEIQQTKSLIKSYRYSDEEYEELEQHYGQLQRINIELKNNLSQRMMEVTELEGRVEMMAKIEKDLKKQFQEAQLFQEKEIDDAMKRERQLKQQLHELQNNIASNEENEQQLKWGIHLYEQQIKRLTNVTEDFQEQINALKLKLTTMTNQEDRIQENLTVMVMTFAEVEALRERMKDKESQINQIRKSLVNLASNEQITSLRELNLGESKKVYASEISPQKEYEDAKRGRETTISHEIPMQKENKLKAIDNQFRELRRQIEGHEQQIGQQMYTVSSHAGSGSIQEIQELQAKEEIQEQVRNLSPEEALMARQEQRVMFGYQTQNSPNMLKSIPARQQIVIQPGQQQQYRTAAMPQQGVVINQGYHQIGYSISSQGSITQSPQGSFRGQNVQVIRGNPPTQNMFSQRQ